MARTAQRYAGGIAESVSELADLQLVQTAGVTIRVHSSAPLLKLYLINERDLFWGFYPRPGYRRVAISESRNLAVGGRDGSQSARPWPSLRRSSRRAGQG